MLRKAILFVKIFLFVVFLAIALYYNENISVGVGKTSITLHSSVFVLILGFVYLIFSAIGNFFRAISAWFQKSNQEEGLQDLQIAFSRMLLRDKSSDILKYLQKSRKYLGDLPIISWLEGQFYLMNEDEHQAKSKFYSLVVQEKSTSFGSLGLYKMAMEANASKDALNAIEDLAKFSDSPSLGYTAVSLALKNKEFDKAKKYLRNLKKTKKFEQVEAIVLSEEGFHTQDIDLLKKSFKLQPQFIENTLRYVDLLMKKEKFRKAKGVLEDTFAIAPHVKLFEKYVECCEEDRSSPKFLRTVEKFAELAPNSWVGWFCVGKLAMSEGFLPIAFENFYRAYRIKHYDFIAKELLDSAKMLSDPKPEEANSLLSKALASEYTNFAWRCEHCGFIEDSWHAICERCSWIGEYQYVNLAEEHQILSEKFSEQLPDYSISEN